MDNNGQLTFSDDPLLSGINEAYQLLEEGEFSRAVKKLDELLNIDPDYHGLIDAYRAAKFWHNRFNELHSLREGKDTADFLMRQWGEFEEYVLEKEMKGSAAYKASMRHVFFKASEHYKISFVKQEDTTHNFDLLLNLGDCFLRLEEYQSAIDTLEYARNSYQSNARMLTILAEAYFHVNDLPKSLLYFREAFLVNPSEIDLEIITAKPINDLADIIRKTGKSYRDIREWIPIYGFINDIFYVRRNLSKHQVEGLKSEVFNLEVNFQKLTNEQLEETNIIPRLINKYLFLLDYYELQSYSFENISEIRTRLIAIHKELFEPYFKNK